MFILQSLAGRFSTPDTAFAPGMSLALSAATARTFRTPFGDAAVAPISDWRGGTTNAVAAPAVPDVGVAASTSLVGVLVPNRPCAGIKDPRAAGLVLTSTAIGMLAGAWRIAQRLPWRRPSAGR